MLGLGLGVTRQSYPAEENPIIFFRQSDFSSGLDTAEADSVQGNLTIEYGQTAPGSPYDDWLKCTYDTAQADPNGQSGLRFNGFVSPPDQNNDTFIEDYDNNSNYFIALAVDVYLEEGFDGTTNTGVRTDLYAGGSYYFARDIDGNGGAGQNVVVPQGQIVKDYASKSGSATGERWQSMGLNASNGDVTLLFATTADYPDASAVFYVRNLRVAISTQDLGLQIPNPALKSVTYDSDFSSTTDGWSIHLSTVSSLTAGVTAQGFDNVLKWSWSDNETGLSYLKRTMDTRVNQKGGQVDKNTVQKLSVSFDIYYHDAAPTLPSPPVNFRSIIGGFGSNGDEANFDFNAGEWTSVNQEITLDEVSGDIFYIGFRNTADFPSSGDEIYLKNVNVVFKTFDS